MDDTDTYAISSKRKVTNVNLRCRILTAFLCAMMLVTGFVLFLLGCLFIWAETTMYNYLKTPVDNFLRVNQLESDQYAKKTLFEALMEYSAPIGQLGFWVGITIMVFCAIGMYGIVMKRPFVVFAFCAMMLAKILIMSVIVMAFHAKPTPVIETFKQMVEESVKGYKSSRSIDKHSLLLNLMMPYLRCCGVNDGEDFAGSKNFDGKFIDGETALQLQYPYPCCKLREDYERLQNKCPATFDDRNSNIKTGCWPKVETHLYTVFSKVSYAFIFITLFELLLTCIAIQTSLTMKEYHKVKTVRSDLPTPCPPPSN